MQSKFFPLHDWILVEVLPEEDNSNTLIKIVEDYKKIYKAKVVAVGLGQLYPVYRPATDGEFANPNTYRFSPPASVSVGEIVMFPQHVAYHIKIDGKYYILVKDHELYGVLENE